MTQEIIPKDSFYPAYPARPEEKTGWEAVQQLSFVVFKWKWLIFTSFIAFTVAGGIAMYLKPPVQTAAAEILIKGDRTPLQISGLIEGRKGDTLNNIVNSEVELIRSRAVLEPVAIKLLASDGNSEKDIKQDEVEAMISKLSNKMVTEALRETSVIRVSYLAETSKEAKDTLSLVIDQYIEVQAAIQSGSSKLLQFYEQEKQRVEAELGEAEERLNQWQEENKTVSIDQQISTELNTLADREKALQQTEAEIESVKATVAMLSKHLNAQPERLVRERRQIRNPLAAKLKTDLVAAQVALGELSQRYTDKDRRVRERREQIAFLEQQLAAVEERIVGEETTGVNPLRENLERQLSDAQARLSSLISQKKIVERQVSETSAELAALRGKKVQIDALSRLVELRKGTFMLYGKKLEEARIATGLGKEQLANVALIGPPHATDETDFKSRVRLVIMGAFVGLVLGMGFVFGLEFFNNSLRTRQDVEYYLGLPVLAAIPDIQGRPALEAGPQGKGGQVT